MYCFYHKDLDGICAGAIIYKYFMRSKNPLDETELRRSKGSSQKFIGINYTDTFPFAEIEKDELVIIVDFSLQEEGDFERLLKITKNVIWIDHHKSAIEKHGNLNIPGIRKDGTAGCLLTWQYFYPEEEAPVIVQMLGAYDVFDFSFFGTDLERLQCGIRLYDTDVQSDNWPNWFRVSNTVYKMITEGDTALKYRNNTWESLLSSLGFWTTFHGHKAICCNAKSVNSKFFDSVKEDHSLRMPFSFDGEQWTVSIYNNGHNNIDCSKLAEKYGGGGHPGASGFQCEELPFKMESKYEGTKTLE